MDIHGTYVKFRQEQVDAHNPDARTRFDEFGHVRPEPTVEGFDSWGPNQTHDREHYATLAQAQVPVQTGMSSADARRMCNMLQRMRRTGK